MAQGLSTTHMLDRASYVNAQYSLRPSLVLGSSHVVSGTYAHTHALQEDRFKSPLRCFPADPACVTAL